MEYDIMNILENISYGYVDKNGNVHTIIDDDFAKLYKLQSPKELLNSRTGVCWDQVELQRYLFEKNNYKVKTYFIVYYTKFTCQTHTFLIYEKDDKFYYFEHAFEKYKGIYEYQNEKDALNAIKNNFIKGNNIDKFNKEYLAIYEYEKPKYGINVKMFFTHCENGKKIVL